MGTLHTPCSFLTPHFVIRIWKIDPPLVPETKKKHYIIGYEQQKEKSSCLENTKTYQHYITIHTLTNLHCWFFLAFRLTADKPQCKHHHKLTCRFFFSKTNCIFRARWKKVTHIHQTHTPLLYSTYQKQKYI